MYSVLWEIYHDDVHTAWFSNHLTKASPCSFLEGETSEDEMGAEDDLGIEGEVGGDRQFFEEGEVQAGDIQEELMEAQEDLGNEDGFGGDREQEEEEQPRRFGRRWVTTG